VHPAAIPPHDPGLGGTDFELVIPADGDARRYRLALAGRHQADNAALAVITASQLACRGIRIPEAAIERGLAKATLPARIETISTRPLVVVDAAHNVASMKALADTLRPALARHAKSVLVFSASNDKQIERMLVTVRGLFSHLVITRYLDNPRAATFDRLRHASAAAGLPRPAEAASPAEALRLAKSIAGTAGVVVVAGSFFLAAEVGSVRHRR